MTSQPLDEERIFHIARGLTDAGLRSDYLDQICAGDQALRERVEGLLRVHEQEQSFLQSAAPSLPETVEYGLSSEKPGVTIGRYRLMEQIGEGGMGTVFVARQDRPIRRKVALKVIKPGMDSKAVVARFEAERQALAMMDHPNIAKVLDAGATDSGRPYFVMEYVRGMPITEYCDRARLDTRVRLRLFAIVCQAIQHAHQKGVIHRDVKPSNVLVTLHDGKPVPKVIDFGVAKALNARLTDKTIYTEHLQIVGTLLYMSPEQAELSGLDVDTRSDIYSLGVLLYELLTGTTPFQQEELSKAGFDEQRRIIREKDPPRASVRISSLGETATIVAEHRKTDQRKLQESIRGDLDWIVHKSMEKDRVRRYESADAFARDIDRFLSDEAVEAHPPSLSYQLKKQFARNRVAILASASVFALVLVGLAHAAWSAKHFEVLASRNAEMLKSLQQTFRSYYEEILERATAAAVSGDLDATQAAIQDAKQVGFPDRFPESLEEFLEAMAALFGGDELKAVSLLKGYVKENPSDAKAWALLFNAYRQQGNSNGYAEAEKRLAETLADSEDALDDYELLFVGFAESDTHVSQPEGVEKLTLLVGRRPSWGLARAMLAQALASLGNDQRKQEIITQAKQELMIAEAILPNNPFVAAVGLHVYSVEIVLAKEHGRPTEDLESEAGKYASTLKERHGDYLFGKMTRARYFVAMEMPQEALNEWDAAVELGGGSLARSSGLCLSLRLNKGTEGHWTKTLAGDRRGVEEALKTPRKEEDNLLGTVWRTYTAKLVGQDEQARKVWEEIRQVEFLPRWLENPVELFLGKREPADLLDEMGESRFWKGHTHFCVAAYYLLSKSDRDMAIQHFDECIAANSWNSDFHNLAIAIREKLRIDENWPGILRMED